MKTGSCVYELPWDKRFPVVGYIVSRDTPTPSAIAGDSDDWKVLCVNCGANTNHQEMKYADDWGYEGQKFCMECGQRIKDVSPHPYMKKQRCFSSCLVCDKIGV